MKVCESAGLFKYNDGLGFYMDGYLKTNLDHLVRLVNNKWDGIVCLDGIEGSGKSTLAVQIGYYLAEQFGTKFNINNVVFSVKQFEDEVEKGLPGTVIVWDEFVFGGLSDEALSKVQTAIIKKMVTMRKKRLVVILVIPFIFMLRKYFAIARSRALIHCYAPDSERGYFSFYTYDQKKELYMKGKKYFNYYIKGNFIGRFTMAFPGIDEKSYNIKKDEAISSALESVIEPEGGHKISKDWKRQRDVLLKEMLDCGVPRVRLSQLTGIDADHISKIVYDMRVLPHKQFIKQNVSD